MKNFKLILIYCLHFNLSYDELIYCLLQQTYFGRHHPVTKVTAKNLLKTVFKCGLAV